LRNCSISENVFVCILFDMPNLSQCIQTVTVLFCCLCAPLHATASASASIDLLNTNPQGAVNDFASLLSAETRTSLESLCRSLLDKTGVSLVLVTTPDCGDVDINDAAVKLFEKWGIGKKGVDEGILMLITVKERMIRIETGYGSEVYVTDAQSSRIIREATPALSLGHWDEGCTSAMIVIATLAARAHNTSLSAITRGDFNDESGVKDQRAKVNILGILFFVVLVLFLSATRSGRSLLLFMLLSSLSSSGRSGGRGFGGGFGSGGFRGFGGGMSGGGGATGRF
jgi:uncharacterized protein